MDTTSALAGALKTLWVKFLPQMQERIAAIEAANRALQAGTLAAEQRSAAAAAAHKLAGVLGTFGLTDGTNLAREAEEIYSSEEAIAPERQSRLQVIAQTLAWMVESRE